MSNLIFGDMQQHSTINRLDLNYRSTENILAISRYARVWSGCAAARVRLLRSVANDAYIGRYLV